MLGPPYHMRATIGAIRLGACGTRLNPVEHVDDARAVFVLGIKEPHEIIGRIGRNGARKHERSAIGECGKDHGQRTRIKEEKLVEKDDAHETSGTAHIVATP